MKILHDLAEYTALVEASPALLCYFSTPECNVCKVLKPKVIELVSGKFPQMNTAWINVERSPVIAGQNRVFSVPTLIIFFDGKEALRKSRNIHLSALEEEIGRIYHHMFRT
jgi:thiol-disulfide isomerase/thioredoxin